MMKQNLIFLFPGPVYFPELPDFRDRYLLLSEFCQGEVYSWMCHKHETVLPMEDFVYRGMPAVRGGLFTKLRLAFFFAKKAFSYNRTMKVDTIVCYDPMFTGFIGFFLKCILRCELIVEVNSLSVGGAPRLFERNPFTGMFKNGLYRFFSFFSLYFADRVKVLTPATVERLPKYVKKGKIVCFHDFVPTHYLEDVEGGTEKFILFIGYPFYLKGVDVLIKAFKQIHEKCPDFKLVLIGHQLEENAKKYDGLSGANIKFFPGMDYKRIKDYLVRCYCLVLPSRTEGMGKVLIEAMSCGKPVVGSDVGGIPSIIEDGVNGFIFQNGDENALAKILDQLISDPNLARKLGHKGRMSVDNKFSSKKYCEHFKLMIEGIEHG